MTANDVGHVIFLTTKNFTLGESLDPDGPYGKRGAVIVRKGGEGLKITDEQAAASGDGSLGFGVGGTSKDNPGTEGSPLQ